METTYKKGRDGWQATTQIDIGPAERHGDVGMRKLEICTRKTRGGIITTASVSLHTSQGSRIHALGFGGPGGDYWRQVMAQRMRCTEANVRAQHGVALTMAGAYEAEARAHYAAKEAR